MFRLYLPPNPFPVLSFSRIKLMSMTEVLAELSAQENSRESDLEEARSIQELMLPAEALRTPQVTVAHAFKPAAEVGGDFLDYFSLADETVGVYLGDVCGKGLPAALYAALAEDRNWPLATADLRLAGRIAQSGLAIATWTP